MIKLDNLRDLGWNAYFENEFQSLQSKELKPGRVSRVNKQSCNLITDAGEFVGEVSGKFHFNAEQASDYPAVGDWVAARILQDEGKALIEFVLKRKNKFSRKEAGAKTVEQIIAANIDYLFCMSSLNQDINLRRIERYLTLALENEVVPIIILTKSDLCDDVDAKISEVKSIGGNTPVHAISALSKTGLSDLSQYLMSNRTVALTGSSGVGKSTFINSFLGSEKMNVSSISLYKDKGRHTTSYRELIVLPEGGLIIDTPGMRELQMWEGSMGVSETFQDVEKYIGQCRFSDCKHDTEPGCAIKDAIERGEFDHDRFKNYLKLQREIRFFEKRNDMKHVLAEKKKWKKITANVRRNKKY